MEKTLSDPTSLTCAKDSAVFSLLCSICSFLVFPVSSCFWFDRRDHAFLVFSNRKTQVVCLAMLSEQESDCVFANVIHAVCRCEKPSKHLEDDTVHPHFMSVLGNAQP